MRVKALVVLEVMWGDPAPIAPAYFHINPRNHSGRRLYSLLGHRNFLVTNACREVVGSAREKGTPDPVLLARNLRGLEYSLLLVCGRVAQETFFQCGYAPRCKVHLMPHPAARVWTKALLEKWRTILQEG